MLSVDERDLAVITRAPVRELIHRLGHLASGARISMSPWAIRR